ncbi:hypothetical protein D8674_027171 [Pyrus ussuriensis x Pyrus communis]|uniref:Uncharacterized protein n=1 Tax=Pyrus ussuriensis x Pyrus communis TaxID=2448454 RepID=A0A5N5IBJ6_9ROSA|nr:hypothetical protein D8674_027171 [Pyrus ussuriensis x Pyrus communis]
MRIDYSQQPVLVVSSVATFIVSIVVFILSVTVSRLRAVEPECTVKWELKLVVTNSNSKHGFDLYIGDHLQSLPPPLLLTSETNQTCTLSFKMQIDNAYFGEELIEEIARGIIQVHLNVMARFQLMPTTSKLEGFHVLQHSCPNMGL